MSRQDDQQSLFGQAKENNNLRPLAHRSRPESFEDFVGQEAIFKRYPFLRAPDFPSLILWGPPGVGKTTLASIMATQSGQALYPFNAVLGGVADLKKLIDQAIRETRDFGKNPVIFIDEIHRFNKAQQDALLPYVERGDFTLIGATTENPKRSLNKALLSRTQVIALGILEKADILKIIKRAYENLQFGPKLSQDHLEKIFALIADHSNGDARYALNLLELIEREMRFDEELSLEKIKEIVLENAREFDRDQDRHYDVISAFIKSMRGSDPNAALLWLAVMLDGGEDPVFIARRLVIFASEDIGNADPSALNLAVSTLQAVQLIGMPEARINLAQATTYLASTYKSNAAYMAINEAMEYVQSRPTLAVPSHLRNFPPKDAPPYLYPHSYPNHYVSQKYTVEETPHFYRPTEMGRERPLKERLDGLEKLSRKN